MRGFGATLRADDGELCALPGEGRSFIIGIGKEDIMESTGGIGRPVRIKICGLRTHEDAAAVNAVVPEYAGFIFDSTRKRYIAPERAEELRRELDSRIRPVGVFVNAGTEEILRTLNVCRIGMVQLHGNESDVQIEELRVAAQELYPERRLTIVKAFRVDSAEDVNRAERSAADLVLLDHGIGGTGEAFDWSLLKECRRDFFLAGGLTPENVSEAICLTHPFCVDASSSLETDGHKDRDKIRRFAAAVRNRI